MASARTQNSRACYPWAGVLCVFTIIYAIAYGYFINPAERAGLLKNDFVILSSAIFSHLYNFSLAVYKNTHRLQVCLH
jgi:hypothetical protein